MAAKSTIPQLVDKKGGSYVAIAPKLELGKFNKWKKRILCYLAGMEPYYIRCIKDGLFQPKTAEGAIKPESQWTQDERRVVIQDQRLKSIIMSCLPDDIMKSVISCETTKATWNDLVHNFKGPSGNFQENSNDELDERTSEEYLRDLDIEYHERALLADSKHFIKGKTFFQPKKLMKTLSVTNVEKGHFARDCFSKTSEPSYKSPMLNFSSVSKAFQPKFTPKLIQSSQQTQNSQPEPKIQKDYKTEYKKMKSKLALFEAILDNEELTQVKVLMALADDELTVGKNHVHNGEWIDITLRKVNILLSMDEDADWKNYLKYINVDLKDELLVLKQAKLEAGTFQIQNTELTKLNHALQEQLKEERKINEKWLTSSKKVSQCINWVERHNPDNKLPNFNTRRILVPESQAVNECVKPTKASNDPELSKDSESESLTPLPPLKNLHGASLSSKRHIKEPIWYLNSGCSRSMTGVKSYLHKYVEQPGPKVVFGDNSSCITEENGSINCSGIVFSKVAFLNGLKYNIISISQLCDAKYIVQFDDKQGTIFNANKIVMLIAPRRNDVYVLDRSSLTPSCHTPNRVPSDLASRGVTSLNISSTKHKERPLRMVENQNDVKVKKIRTDNGTKFKNYELESFCDEKGIYQNFSSPYTYEQNGVAERKNRTLIEAARTMLNGSVLSKNLWTEEVRIACYTQNRSIIVKRHDRTPYEIFIERIPDISYFYVFGCHVFIHNHKDHLGKFDAKADDGYFLGYSFNSKAFRVFNTRRQQIEKTYHVTFDESMEAIRFINTLVDEIGIDDSSRYPPDEYHHKDDPSRQYQLNSNISYYIIPHGRSLTELTQEKHIPEVNAPNEHDIPYSEGITGPPDPTNTKGTQEQNV
ncbi:retrovirus-related pol polyprotein from transposon TNT 1-94 [Tanacetum coccineum]